ncbi:hypothetical protein HK102_004934 [Quaeritorhiza haematococci]|nr:hypothetical protein HK102_004934 [Quaeritorhiza haematococci]
MADLTTIAVSKDYAYVIMCAAAMSAQIFVIGGSVAGARKKYNVKYPDMGCGRYAAKLDDKSWEEFNNIQRTHYNYVEQIGSVISLELLSGLFFPKFAAVTGFIYIIGRQVYTMGYKSRGPQGRMAGSGIQNLAFLTLLGSVFYGSARMAKLF